MMLAESKQSSAAEKPVYSARMNIELNTEPEYQVLDEHVLDTVVEDTEVQDLEQEYHVLEQHELGVEDTGRKETKVHYENLTEPLYHDTVVTTVEEWLIALGLSCYVDVFEENGWENLMVLGEMTNSDLDRMGIKNINHRSLILSCIEDFKSC